MTDLRQAAQQALEACEQRLPLKGQAAIIDELNNLRAALAGPCPCGDRPADQCPGEWEPGCDLGNNPKYAKRAEPKGGGNLPPPLQAEPVAAVAENATTQQRAGETPPSDYRRGYWDGFEMGKREGRIEAEDAQAEPVQEPVACEPQYANDDGWCDWVCPKPIGYLMQCCGCDLIHEVESRVAKYQPRPSEEFEVVDDPDLQVQWRMKRRDDISPKQKTQEPVAWRFEAKHIDSAWGAAVSLKHPGPEGVYMRKVTPLYTAPPQRKQAEPLNLSDRAVQRRLAAQWGYVPAAQAEPVEPVATLIAQRDTLLEALKPMIDLAEFWINHRQERHMSEEQYRVWLALGHESNAMLKARAAIALVEGRVKAVEENT